MTREDYIDLVTLGGHSKPPTDSHHLGVTLLGTGSMEERFNWSLIGDSKFPVERTRLSCPPIRHGRFFLSFLI